MALALRLFLLLLLAVALSARAAQAAPLPVRRADWYHDLDYLEALLENGLKFLEDGGAEPVGEGDLASKPTTGTEPLGDGQVTGVAAGSTSPTPGLDTTHKPGSHRRGPPKGKPKHMADKKSPKPFEVMWQMLKELLQAGQEVDGEAVQKAAFPGESSGSLAASASGREAMPGTVPGDWYRDLDYLEALLENGLKFLEDGGAEPVGEGDLASKPTTGTEPLGDGQVTGVAAGSTSPTPGLDTTHKPGSHRRGPPKGKPKHMADKKSPKPFEVMWQMLKELLQAGQEVDGEAVQKAAFPGESSGSLAASASGREAMPGTVPGDEVAGKASPFDWLNKVLKPLEPPAGVSAERTFPAPVLVPTGQPSSHRRGPPKGKTQDTGAKNSHESDEFPQQTQKEMLQAGQGVTAGSTSPTPGLDTRHKPGSHRRGPPRGKYKPRGEKESLKSNNILKQIVLELQKGNEVDGEAVQKAAFPGESSGSLAASASGREAMPGTVPGDWYHDLDYLEALLENGLKFLEDVTGVTAGSTSPTPGLDTTHKPGSHRRGPPRGKYKPRGEKESLKSNNILKQIVLELQKGNGMDIEFLWMAAFPEGSSRSSVPGSASGRKAMASMNTGLGTGDWYHDLDYLEALLENGLKFLEDGGAEPVGEGDLASKPTTGTEPLGDGQGVSAERTFPAPVLVPRGQPSSHRR
ncbi:unnamed protein product, partial [Coccothraustes coccothraustes]